MLKVGIDFDDVLCPFVEEACQICNEDNGTNYKKTDITKWGYDVCPEVAAYYDDDRTFARQKVEEDAKVFLQKLMEKADVYIMTAVQPKRMGIRATQIKEAFPFFPDDHILLGTAKNLVRFDVILDDAPHNILKSCATFPVVFRQPWNYMLSGVLSVRSYDDFLVLIDQIKAAPMECAFRTIEQPTVFALVGPSGSKKNELAKRMMAQGRIGTIVYSSTKGSSYSAAETVYAGERYCLDKRDIESLLGKGKNVITVVDMCGAMSLKRAYPTTLVFCKRSRELMIEDILQRDIPLEQKKLRLLSIEQELKNEALCDVSVRTDKEYDIAAGASKLYSMMR